MSVEPSFRTPSEHTAPLTWQATHRVAIVDGDRAGGEMLHTFFRLIEMDSSLVEPDSAAAATICRLVPSAVVIDFDLPNLRAVEIFREIRRQMPGLPVVFLTAGDPPPELTADRCVAIRKPLDDFEALLRLAEIILNGIL
ncbi:MAG TPA: response regulator [Thermoanaerobaculia bacterium]|nr:response regulator [Thermoanaerobaculia bacterium]